MNQRKPNALWTRDFTIITLGSIVSMLGNSVSNFAMSLLVVDQADRINPDLTGVYYAIFMFLYMLPQVMAPIISGPILDRFSRKRVIYCLDFFSSAIYFLLALLLWNGWYSFPIVALFAFIVGAVSGTYTVAYNSFYPLTVRTGYYSKAYSVSSTLETLTMVGIPLSAVIYNLVGIGPLFLFNGVSFLVAAIFETRIRTEEHYLGKKLNRSRSALRQFADDFKDGFVYLKNEKGLFGIVAYFFFSSFAAGAALVITLPYFRSTWENGEYYYMLVWGLSMVGKLLGGLVLYRKRIPPKRVFLFALLSCLIAPAFEGIYLYFPVAVMVGLTFIVGIAGAVSYNIRQSVTQNHVPDEKKGRFNGNFTTINSFGQVLGIVFSGGMCAALSMKYVLTIFMGLCTLAAVVFIGGYKKHLEPMMNREV